MLFFFFSSRRRHTRWNCDWSSDVCSSDLAVAREVPILPPVDAFPFLPAEHRLVFDVEGLFGIVGKLIRPVCTEAQAIFVVDEVLVPVETELLPVVKPLLHFAGMHKKLQVPLLELAQTEQEVPRCNLVTEGFTDLADAEGNLHTRGLEHIFVVQEDVLAGLTAQVGFHALAFNDPNIGLHHQVESTRLCEFAATIGTLFQACILFWQM